MVNCQIYGIIKCADEHSCPECTHPYKAAPDVILHDDPAAIIGIDENHEIPALQGEDAQLAANYAQQHQQNQAVINAQAAANPPEDVDDAQPVRMVIMDGIVMGPTHCAYENCAEPLENARDGVFCHEHQILMENRCLVKGCHNDLVAGTKACVQHRATWRSHVIWFGRQTLLGIRRLIRRTAEEGLPWLPQQNVQPLMHDAPQPDQVDRHNNYFTPCRFYCVETICAPCGTVIAWTKFAKSESPTHIIQWLDHVFPTEESRPDYVCIDKACMVLRTAVTSYPAFCNSWKNTTRFIVDSYHYINHWLTDYLCRRWCNPAPIDGTAPNLVTVVYDEDGNPHYQRAFNTQVSGN